MFIDTFRAIIYQHPTFINGKYIDKVLGVNKAFPKLS